MFSSYKTSKGKNKDFVRKKNLFCNADANVDANADAEMPIPRFPNGFDFKKPNLVKWIV